MFLASMVSTVLLALALGFPALRAAEQPAISDADSAAITILSAGLELPQRVAEPDAAGTDVCCGNGAACDARPTTLWDNLYLQGTLDGFKSPVDFGLNGHFSFNMAANWGYPLIEQLGIGVQLGSSVNFASFLVPSFKSATELDHRRQSFTTLGVFQRDLCGVSWAVGYDFLFDDYYLDMQLGQWRADVSYRLTASDELGVWATTGDHGDSGTVNFPFFAGRVHWEPITQGNLYWRHTWSNGADTRWWFGVADTESDFVFGGEFRVPLSDCLVLIGSANFLVAPDEGSTTASTGLAFHPRGGACRAAPSRFAPLLPVANNSTFVVDRF
jgi:hypothetical protein